MRKFAKTKLTKKEINSRVVAEIIGCSESQVKKVWHGKIKRKTPMQKRIQQATELLEVGNNKLINEVKRIVKF